MALVVVCPNSGNPELSSKIEPTAAIAAMEEPNKKIPLLGVTKSIPQLMKINNLQKFTKKDFAGDKKANYLLLLHKSPKACQED